jgi:hypothetical protein
MSKSTKHQRHVRQQFRHVDGMRALEEAYERGQQTKVVVNLMSQKLVRIPSDTPMCCDPSSETYWSM